MARRPNRVPLLTVDVSTPRWSVLYIELGGIAENLGGEAMNFFILSLIKEAKPKNDKRGNWDLFLREPSMIIIFAVIGYYATVGPSPGRPGRPANLLFAKELLDFICQGATFLDKTDFLRLHDAIFNPSIVLFDPPIVY